MIKVEQVKTKKQQKAFLDFPNRLYRDNPNYAPALYLDEKKIFRKDYVYYDTSEAVYYLAYDDGKVVGRISGILQRASNEKWGQKRVRFTRFDCVDDEAVAEALFGAVEEWAKEKGMEEVVGPLGFSDFEREGLLIEGFGELSTFEEQYNADYYGKFIENLGYKKEVDWVESRIYAPDGGAADMQSMSEFVMQRYDLHIGTARNIRDFLRKYSDQFFELLDLGYKDVYGTVPFTPALRKMMIENFKLVINLNYVAVILDKNNKIVCLGLCFPSLTKALQKTGGKLTPGALIRVLRAIRHPEIIDLGLVAVDPAYINCGVSIVVCAELAKMLENPGILYAETNLNLENNHAIRNQWKRFHSVEHKRRRSYVKKLTDTQAEEAAQ